ncbi:MAG TPA: HD domain-containing protein [Armatimonadota bacterium]|nr:HD domain-containing protein [Armatimonadota bacterium]HOM72702.1 HD domain-containing protein [Armatimonadota bacterium]HOP79108.1 HD domain-containing protein [Armatimonadota bacterium]HPP74765.1 HD domain-containing protein [Armatimonadota bacterium]
MAFLQRLKRAVEPQKPRLPKVLHAMEMLLVQQQGTNIERDRDLDWEYDHMNDSIQYAKMLAVRRKIDPDLAACAVAAQNIGRISSGVSEGHAEAGYELAKNMYVSLGCFTDEEVEMLATAVRNHSFKDKVQSPLDELAKDVDIYVRYVHGYEATTPHEIKRLTAIRLELQTQINK